MKHLSSFRLLLAGPLALLAFWLTAAPAVAQVIAGRAAPTVEARKQVLREALRLAPNADLRPTETEADPLGFVHEQYQLYYQGVKVEHALLRVHSRAGKVESVSGETLQLASGLSVQPGLSEAAALQRAMAVVGARTYMWQLPAEEAALKQQTGKPTATYQPQGELVLVGDFRQPEANRPLVLAWKFNIYAQEPVSRAWFYVDAHTGQVVLRDAIIKHANAPGASFATRYVGARTSITDNTGSGYRLRETATSRGVTTLNVRKGNTFSAAIDFVDNDNNWTAAEHDNANFDNAALDAHLGAQATQGYWSSIHGRDSYDDRGTVLLSYVHYDDTPATPAGTDNAFWNGTAMLYGDGNTAFKPLTAIDVCGHEIGHAVCQTTANLVYSNESGALNEGMSDIWGCCVENHFDPAKQVYLIGEDICKPSFGLALRSMSNPNAFGQPDTYKGTNWRTGTADNGGVHYNSGVLNYWFYLLSAGGSGSNDFGTSFNVAGISIAKSERIAYRAERFYMTSTTNYLAARQATLQAAIDLYGLGSAEATATALAWRAVGVGTTTGALEGVPTITSFAPTSGPTGTEVTITGTNLGATYKVTFNGVDARIATLSTGATVRVTVPGTATTGIISLTTPSGVVTTSALSPANFTVSAPGLAPTITSYLPAAGQVQGGAVTIAGTNFTGATAVSFNGTAAAFTVVSATSITTTVPVGATSGALTVTTPNGTATAPTTFLVLPAITSFSPTSGAVGAAVTITGTSFTGATVVRFNGVYATAFTVVNATTITTTVPNGATTGPITVRTPSGTATSLTNFTVTSSLSFDSFTPTIGVVGTVVNIRGRGFTGTSAITFGGVNTPTYTVASDLEIWATVPTGAQTGNIGLTTPLGAAISPAVFTVDLGQPVVSSFTPTSGPVGTAVALTGNYFTGTTAVRFNGTAATFTAVNNTTINTTVPAGATTGTISVTNAAGTGTSTAIFSLPPPNNLCANALPLSCGGSVTGTTVGASNTGDPTAACGGRTPSTSGGVFYQITGNGSPITLSACTGTTYDMVLFVYTGSCGTYTCVTSDDDGCGNTNGGPSTLTFNSTSGTNYLVYVTGFNTAQGTFTLSAACGAAPTISSFTPASGAGGTVVSITGTNFTGATAVRFAGVAAASFTVNSATSLSATAPAGVVTGPISVVAPGGTATSTTDFVGPPTISSFTPTVGPVGTSVTVSGTGFTGTTAVRFNGTAATTFSVTNGTTLTATVPAGATTGPISVVNVAGTGTSSTNFTVGLPLVVSSLSPTRNARAAARTTNVGITFNQNLNAATAGNVRVHSAQRGGQLVRGGNASASAAVLTVNPANDLKPGETVQVSVPASVTTGAGGAARPHVYQFTAAAGGTGVGSFQPGSDFATGDTPSGVAAADVDGDGDLDLLSANFGTNTVSVRLNNGSGVYSGNQTVTVGAQPYDVVTADVDGDGDLDFVATNYTDGTVSVRLNGGDATGSNTGVFSNGSTVTVGTNPYNTAVADVDGDGDLDLLTANYSSTAATVSVRLNGGNATGSNTGTFSNGSVVSVGNGGGYVTVGDVDGDGDLDLLSADYNANTVSVRLNGGDATGSNTGTFSGGSAVSVGVATYSVAVGDVDGDGDLDFIAANQSSGTVSVRLNNGTGTFAAGSTVSVGTSPTYAGLADVDADGDLDIITANFGTNTASVRLNGGAGTFTGTTNVAVGPKPYGIALGDVDGDGDLDLLAANTDDGGATTGSVSVRFNQAPAPAISGFAPTSGVAGTSITLSGTNLTGATAVTVNGVAATPGSITAGSLSFNVPAGCSTTQSINVTTPGGSSAANTTFTVRLAVASSSPAVNARSAPRTSSAVGLTFSEPVTSASVTTAASRVKVFSAQVGGRKAGTWTGGGSTTINYTSSLSGSRASFMPGEVVSVSVPATVLGAGGLAATKKVYQFTAATGGTGAGFFIGGSTPTMGGAINGLALGDVDGDGRPDLLTPNYGNPGAVSVALNNGSGGYNAPTTVTVGNYPINVSLADIDGDGDLDFVTCNYGNPSGSGSTASVCFNNGAGGFGTATTLTTGGGPRGVTFGDVDGDGDLDLLVPIGSGVQVFANNGSGVFTLGSTVGGISFSTGVVVGDVDGDGDLDLAANSYNSSTGTVVYVRINDGAGNFSGSQNVAVGQGPFVALLGDLDGDGDLDLASTSQTTNAVSIRFNNGSGTFAPPAIAANGEVSVSTAPTSLALGDLDGDGDLDFVSSGSASSSIRLNNGSGVFSAPSIGTGTTTGGNFTALADLDGDGDLDVAIGSGGTTVAVRLNAPAPPVISTFNPTSGVAGTSINLTGTGLSGATSVSVNGVAVVPTSVTATSLSFVVPAGCSTTQSITVTALGGPSAASTAFTVLLRSGVTGTLPAVNAIAAARLNSAVAIGFTEPVTGASMATTRVFSTQVGGRKAGAWTMSGSTAGFASNLAASLRDFRPGELVQVSMPGSVLSAGGLTTPKRVYQFTTATGGTGRGNFGGGSDLGGGNFVTSTVLGDVTGDGRLDLLWTNYGTNTVSLAPALSAGGFGPASSVTVGNNPINMFLADFNGDGALDFVTVNYGIPSGSGTTLSIGLNGGTGTFTVSTRTTGTGPRGAAVGDVDGDGDLDLMVAIGNGVEVYANNGSGTFTLASTSTGINFATNIATGDVDGDGDLDLLTANYGIANTVSLRLNNGSGTFTAPTNTPEIPVGLKPYNLSVADIDGDGDLDLLTANSDVTTVSVRFNNGSGVFSAPGANGEVALPAGAANVAIGDVDSDGDLDFIAGGAIRLNNGSGVFSPPAANPTVPGVSNFVALADIDNDGDLDVAAAVGSSTGTAAATVRMNQATAPLPVELVVFTATAKGQNVQLNWRTASEKNSVRFEVERSLDGQQFAHIGEVAGQGTKASPTDYAYLDSQVPKTPSPQVPIYYRLRQVDMDGTAAYSPVRAVTLGGKELLTLYPNPAHGAVTVGGIAAGATVEVFDALGRVVAQATADAAGSAQLALPVGLAAGVYTVRSGPNALRLTVE